VQVCLRSTCAPFPLRPTFGGRVLPQKLPTDEYAPAAASIFGKIGAADGYHPPALREVEVDIDKDVKINVKGLPVCSASIQIEEGGLEKACKDALVGEGKAHIEISLPGVAPEVQTSHLLVYNRGERSGEVRLLVRASVAKPVPAAIEAAVAAQRVGTGVHTVWTIPVVAGGYGSLLDFRLKIGRTYSSEDKKTGYFEAKCPDGVFKANVKKILFKNEAHTPGEAAQTSLKGAFAVPCTGHG
jgi:hypothetical protein